MTFSELHDRLKSPLFGNFFVSWLIVNWKIPYFTFFVSEKTLDGQTKLEGVLNIVEGYESPVLWLFVIPCLSTLFILFIYPLIFNGLEWIHLFYQRKLHEIREKGERDLIPVGEKLKYITNEYEALNRNTKREIEYSFFHFNEPLKRLFAGTWRIEIDGKIYETFDGCYFKESNVFYNSKGLVLEFNSVKKDVNFRYDNQYECSVKIKDNNESIFNLYIQSRSHIELTEAGSSKVKVRFFWLGM